MYIPTHKPFGRSIFAGYLRQPPFAVTPPAIKSSTTTTAIPQSAPAAPALSEQKHDAVSAAVQREQRRLQEIDQVADVFPAELVQEAKYGKRACSAQELARRAAVAEGKFYSDSSPEYFRARVEIRRLLRSGS